MKSRLEALAVPAENSSILVLMMVGSLSSPRENGPCLCQFFTGHKGFVQRSGAGFFAVGFLMMIVLGSLMWPVCCAGAMDLAIG